ncbi:Uncharacterised protein [Vibrio cholerae]|nr:Uncharacterised protein [Vibrio cholerae]
MLSRRSPFIIVPTDFSPSTLVASWLAFNPVRASVVVALKCSAVQRAIGVNFWYLAVRSFLTRSPVLMPTGQRSAHNPVAAQVSNPWYSNTCSSSLEATFSPAVRRRCNSRYNTMRWRGDNVRVRDGQTGSQKPHSIQRSTKLSAAGMGLRLLMCECLSSLMMTPGLSKRLGSKSALIFCIKA